MFQDIRPIAPSFLDAKDIPTPQMFRQNLDFSLKLGKVPTEKRSGVPGTQ